MIFISIDIGIKNCSLCIFEVEVSSPKFNIIFWDNLDLTNTNTNTNTNICNCLKKNGEMCMKPATFTMNHYHLCNIHAKHTKSPTTNKDWSTKKINKMSDKKLTELSQLFQLNINNMPSKITQIENIFSHIEHNYLTPIPKIKVEDTNLIEIGKNVIVKFDHILTQIGKPIDLVIIENQIGPLAIKMKTLQGMVTQYFLMRQPGLKVEWVSSTNKLREFTDNNEKLDYKQRKQKSIQICSELLIDDTLHHDIFVKHRKKDDLADCFLQGIWYLRKKLN